MVNVSYMAIPNTTSLDPILGSVDPVQLLTERKRGPNKHGTKRILVNYRWNAYTHGALAGEANRLGVSAAALAETIVVVALQSTETRAEMQRMATLK